MLVDPDYPDTQPPGINWDHPTGGLTVSSIDGAEDYLGFSVLVPRNLSSPTITVINPESPLTDSRGISLLFTTDCGPVELTENMAELEPDQFHSDIQAVVEDFQNAGPTWPGYAAIETIRGGIPALLTIAPGNTRTGLDWYENGIEFILRGPGMSQDQAVQLANGI